MAYTTKHETELDSAEKMKVFIDQLDQISGSAVLYGAAANYTGDRAQLCTLFGEDALETSVSWLLDAYGYLDMNDYAQQDTADTTAVEPASTADISSADYIFPSDRQYITESDMAGWDQKTALLARNEIFARHGYVFQTQEIQNYFAAKSWYTPNSSYDGSDLSDVEKANVDTISTYEQKMGWAEQDVSPTKLAQGAVSSYVESQGDYCTGFDYVRPYAENEYLVCAKIGEYEWEAEYIVEVNGSDAWVIGRLDGGVFRPV
ncbi:MAG: YARHG domain-containing protein [Butyricicoccus sp.]